MKLDKEKYLKKVESLSPPSPTVTDMIKAFTVGGLICVIGEVLVTVYTRLQINEADAKMLSSVTLVFLAALLTGLGVFDKIAKFAGAGTLVPITGFANAVVSPAVEYKSEGKITGLGAKMFTVAGPVLVYGITASAVLGVIIYFIGMV